MALTSAQRQLFEKLHSSKLEDLKTFQKKNYRGIWSSIIDKYPETAHFVYELLQNADDAEATIVNIVVKANELLFKHNGTKHFDITAEDDERTGDINSITGIGDSTKPTLSNKIGKFGVGFKAVFQYTDTPEIYDDAFKFKIENYIVPCLLEYDHPFRNDGETLFVFPYKNPERSYNDIVNRLKKLENPLLFLSHLQSIQITIYGKDDTAPNSYSYSKEIVFSTKYEDGIVLYKYLLHEPGIDKSLFLFSEDISVRIESNQSTIYPIYVGYYYDEEQRKLITDTKQKIYCFFPTKESFNSCFISHAPFLLTDNRQNLKPNEKYNKQLIKFITSLAAQALVKLRDYGLTHKNLLIDENITEILPVVRRSIYYRLNDELFEEPLYNAYDDILKKEALFVSRNGSYLMASEAFITTPIEIRDLITVTQFNELRGGKGNLDFVKLELQQHLRDIDSDMFYEEIREYKSESIAHDINQSFMEHQDIKWVTKLYNFLRKDAVKLWKTDSGNFNKESYPFRFAPIIKNQNNQWVSPNNETTTLNVFYPLTDQALNDKYNFIHKDYLANESARKFFDELGVKTPDDLDYIRSVIIPKYSGDDVTSTSEEAKEELEVIINYYKKIKDDEVKCSDFIRFIAPSLWLYSDDEYYRLPNELHWNSNILDKYYERKLIYYVDTDFYQPVIDHVGYPLFKDFLSRLGVSSYPHIITNENLGVYELSSRMQAQINSPNYSECLILKDYELDYFEEAANKRYITKELSIYLWNEVLPAIHFERYDTLSYRFREKYARGYRTSTCISTFKDDLVHLNWIYDDNDHLTCPCNTTLENLSPEYNRNNGLIHFLDIKKSEKSIIELGGTSKQQDDYQLGKDIRDEFGNDLTPDEIKNALRKAAADKKAKKDDKNQAESITSSNLPNVAEKPSVDNSDESLDDKLKKKWENKANEQNKRPRPVSKNDDTPLDLNKSHNNPNNNQPFFDNDEESNNQSIPTNHENDEKAAKALLNKNDEAQEKAQKAAEQVEILEMLHNTPKYTFLWYKLLMELMHSEKSTSTDRHIQVDFSEWSFECTDKILRLSNPSRPIPSWLVDSEQIEITALSDKTMKIDGIVVKADERSIDISIDYSEELVELCNKTKKYRVIADNSTSIIDALERRFLQLGYEDDYNLNDNLTKDIQFIYGPPGTGKTTKVVQMIHEILTNRKEKTNILILTPTNKAADVIAEKMVNDDVCYDYLTRFGATESTYLIEDAAVVLNRDTLDMDLLDSNIVVTTAIRYSYDCIQPDNTFICDYPWDYIVIDEASMIDIITVTYILHKGADSKIIIAGDPKQIQPVAQNDMPAYNIYDMVGLKEFVDAVHNYNRYPVITLTTQYRSIPVIGDLVSNYAYGGLVKSDPNRNPQKPLQLDGLTVRDVNFLGFDIVDFDLIKGIGSIEDSAFHLYSAIFTYNFAEYIAKQVNKKYPGQLYTVGIVCPYKKEADAIGQMLENRPVDNNCCQVKCGTVHSFQGDECDIMLIVLNPPLRCSAGSHINNVNILNVAMSRARDYIFFIMPYGQTPGFYQKSIIGKCVDIAHRSITKCEKIEEVMFGDRDFITSNTHVTCHMPVNVYRDSNALYEVRISDEALDIKINHVD